MFFVKLRIERECLYGLEALDERRRLRLPDLADLRFSGDDLLITVTEGFARRYSVFKNNNYAVAKIGRELLIPGDLKPGPHNPEYAVWGDVGFDRMQELAQIAMSNA